MGKSQKQKIAESIQREELGYELQRIIRLAKRIKSQKKDLQHSYFGWSDINLKTIDSLVELKDKILCVNTAADAVGSVATIAEILGGVLSIVGAIADKPDLVKTGDKVTKGGSVVNLGTVALKNFYLKDLCDKATMNFQRNKCHSDAFEKQRYSYFQQLEEFKRELRTSEANYSLPLLLETAQREGFDFLGNLGFDESSKSRLRTNLRQMCRSNSKKIRATTDTVRTNELGGAFAREIRRMLSEFKQLLDEDNSLFSIFSDEAKTFLGENVDNLVPILDNADSWLQRYGMDLFRGGQALYGLSSDITSASRTEVGVMSGVRLISSFRDLMLRISDIEKGSKSIESEELEERIEEMKERRKNIIEAMKENFGWNEPSNVQTSYPALTN